MERVSVVVVFLILVTFCVNSAISEWPTKEFVDQLKPVLEKCEEKTEVNKDLVEQFSKGASMVDDPKLKCYMKCVFLEFDVLNEATGVFRNEKMLNILPEEMRETALNMGKNCIHLKGADNSDLCQLSYDIHKCWQKADPEHYFLM